MTYDPAGLPVRRSGRVLLVDGQGRLLLFGARERRPDGSEREVWFPPGGGVESGESFAECAVRELREETGLRLAIGDLGPVVAVRSGAFILSGVNTWSDETFFFVRVPVWEVDTAGFTELEQEVVTAHRWWSLAELQSTRDLVFPPRDDLARLVTRLLSSGRPSRPVRLAWESRNVER